MPDVDHYNRWFQTLVPRASKTARPHIADTGNGVRKPRCDAPAIQLWTRMDVALASADMLQSATATPKVVHIPWVSTR